MNSQKRSRTSNKEEAENGPFISKAFKLIFLYHEQLNTMCGLLPFHTRWCGMYQTRPGVPMISFGFNIRAKPA